MQAVHTCPAGKTRLELAHLQQVREVVLQFLLHVDRHAPQHRPLLLQRRYLLAAVRDDRRRVVGEFRQVLAVAVFLQRRRVAYQLLDRLASLHQLLVQLLHRHSAAAAARHTIRYDTIPDAILTCDQKVTRVRLIDSKVHTHTHTRLTAIGPGLPG